MVGPRSSRTEAKHEARTPTRQTGGKTKYEGTLPRRAAISPATVARRRALPVHCSRTKTYKFSSARIAAALSLGRPPQRRITLAPDHSQYSIPWFSVPFPEYILRILTCPFLRCQGCLREECQCHLHRFRSLDSLLLLQTLE